ncbi:hypothetical protein [Micromonospora sp. CPCC 206061]|uniref:hypothetical protein n=1 Tax=Micromonospora sp. CPCC 206061 TaxID=3122410 RepID=UPI002FF1163A
MSLIQELGARVRATSDDLPVGLVTAAVERLRLAGELLMWVRQTSGNPMGVPQLAGALEHAEQAAQAVRVAQDSLLAYLTALGLTHDGAAGPDGAWRAGLAAEGDRPVPPSSAPPPPLGQWWAQRVSELTGHEQPPEANGNAATEGADLMRRVAAGVHAGDRDRLRRELAGASAPIGLGMSALAPPVLHRLTSDLLRHLPGPDDLPMLTREAGPRVRDLLPGLPPAVLDTLLARVCRVPPAERAQGEPATHPADSAVASGVLTGVLLQLLHREPDSLDPHAPEPVQQPEPNA